MGRALVLSVQHDLAQMAAMLRALSAGELRRAQVQAINKVGATARGRILRQVAGRMGIAQKRVKRSFDTDKATKQSIRYRITATGRPIPLIAFGAKQTRRGVTATAWQDTPGSKRRKLYGGTFIRTMKAGHRGVYRKTGPRRAYRKPELRVQPGPGRTLQPIRELWGPSVPGTMAEEVVEDAARRVVSERLPIEFDRAARLALRRLQEKTKRRALRRLGRAVGLM